MNEIAKYIDHTFLKANGTKEQVIRVCDEARKFGFAAVCTNPVYTSLVAEVLKGSDVKVCTVVGFPLGATTTEVKVFETQQAVNNGAQEIDMVINIGALKSGELGVVENDIAAVVRAAGNAIVKVIIETCYLSEREKEQACMAAYEAGAHFIKTSTGFGISGATEEDVRLIKKVVGDKMGIKASGGIRDMEAAFGMIKAGATRIGTSSGVDICEGKRDIIVDYVKK